MFVSKRQASDLQENATAINKWRKENKEGKYFFCYKYWLCRGRRDMSSSSKEASKTGCRGGVPGVLFFAWSVRVDQCVSLLWSMQRQAPMQVAKEVTASVEWQQVSWATKFQWAVRSSVGLWLCPLNVKFERKETKAKAFRSYENNNAEKKNWEFFLILSWKQRWGH